MKWAVFLLLSPFFLLAKEASFFQEDLRRIEKLLFIESFSTALKISSQLLEKYPEEKEVQSIHIQSLIGIKEPAKALECYLRWEQNFKDFTLLEKICWAFLEEGVSSSQYAVQIASLMGAFFTQDAKTVLILLKMMDSSHAAVRSLAVQLSGYYGDQKLKEKIGSLVKKENAWPVRLELIQALGKLGIKKERSYLEKLLEKEEGVLEEKMAAIQALVDMYEEVPWEKISPLVKSRRAYTRILACRLISHFSIKKARGYLVPLFYDEHPHVRIEALNAFALTFFSEMDQEEEKIIRRLAHEKHPFVAITASWILFLKNPKQEFLLKRWLEAEKKENRWVASAALSTAGQRGILLAKKMIQESKDPYVRVNLALGLIRHGEKGEEEKEILVKALNKEGQRWMRSNVSNYLFPMLVPSNLVREGSHFSVPEQEDQKARFEMISLLALLGDCRAEQYIHSLLAKNSLLTKEALFFLWKEKPFFSSELINLLLKEGKEEQRLQKALVLAIFAKEERALQELEKAYFSASYEQKIQILEAMFQIGRVENASFFKKVLQEPFLTLRILGASAFLQAIKR